MDINKNTIGKVRLFRKLISTQPNIIVQELASKLEDNMSPYEVYVPVKNVSESVAYTRICNRFIHAITPRTL